MNTGIQQDEIAWRQGYVAGMKNHPSDCNPYPGDDDRALAWISGYIEGKANPDTLPQMRPIRQDP